jgi:DNA-directed RNA polymerase subunit RPC12/RpoP
MTHPNQTLAATAQRMTDQCGWAIEWEPRLERWVATETGADPDIQCVLYARTLGALDKRLRAIGVMPAARTVRQTREEGIVPELYKKHFDIDVPDDADKNTAERKAEFIEAMQFHEEVPDVFPGDTPHPRCQMCGSTVLVRARAGVFCRRCGHRAEAAGGE